MTAPASTSAGGGARRTRLGYPQAIALGLATSSQRLWIAAVAGVVDLFATFVAVAPLRSFAGRVSGNYAVQRLADRFDATTVGDLLRRHGTGAAVALSMMAVAVLVYVPISWLVEGGILGLLSQDEDAPRGRRLTAFGARAGENLVRMARCAVLSLGPYLAALLLLALGYGIGDRVTAGAVNARHVIWARWIGATPGLLALVFAVVFADVLRVRAVLIDAAAPPVGVVQWTSRTFRGALRTTARWRTIAARLTFAVLWLAATWMAAEAVARLPHRTAWIWFGFLIGLLVLFVRAALAVASYAALAGLVLDEEGAGATAAASPAAAA